MLLDCGNYVCHRSLASAHRRMRPGASRNALVKAQYDPKLYLTLARDLAFVIHLFNTWPRTNKKPKDDGVVQDVDTKGKHKARIFTLWLTTLGVEPGVFDLSGNLEDGLIILQVFHKILAQSFGDACPRETPAGMLCQSLDGEAWEVVGITLNESMLHHWNLILLTTQYI
ncbi:hypothetical protein V8E55_007095 [Tylopilus felleus]